MGGPILQEHMNKNGSANTSCAGSSKTMIYDIMCRLLDAPEETAGMASTCAHAVTVHPSMVEATTL
jgi:hypothetical protein